MKRLLLWLIGVALGVVVLLAAVLGVSYSFTSEGAKPASEVQFAGQELEPNGWCWQVPLLGGQVDKVFASPRTLTVQKLGVLYDAHPAFALPEWYSYGPLTITDSAGNVVFEGTAATYDDFLFPANGDYKAELTVWRLPENMLATQFEGGSTGELRQDVRLEKPAKPIGWYYYSFRFTLQASAEVAALNDTDRFIFATLLDAPDRINELGRRKRERMAALLDAARYRVEFDPVAYTEVLHGVAQYCERPAKGCDPAAAPAWPWPGVDPAFMPLECWPCERVNKNRNVKECGKGAE